jgi:alpha-glucoside transport system permease protein
MTAPAKPVESSAARKAYRPAWFARTPLRVAVIGICLLWSLPTLGTFVTSFRNPIDITTSGWWEVFLHPFQEGQWSLNNYAVVLGAEGMLTAFVNSLIVTIPSTIIPITIAAFAAYAFAWIRFPGRAVLFAVVVGLLVVPLQMALIPILRLYGDLGLYGTFLGIWLAHTAFGLPLAIVLLYNFISQLPRDLFESASIDGATHFQTFTRLVLPLSVPALGAFAIFQFLWVWNDLLIALVFLGPGVEQRVMPTALSVLVGNRGTQWHILTAGAFVTMILPLIVFLLLQRAFVRGILAGSVKS